MQIPRTYLHDNVDWLPLLNCSHSRVIFSGIVSHTMIHSYTCFGTFFPYNSKTYPFFVKPAAVLLHLTRLSRKLYSKSLLIHLLNTARACIPYVETTDPPTHTHSMALWFARVNDIQQMEKLTLALRDKAEAQI